MKVLDRDSWDFTLNLFLVVGDNSSTTGVGVWFVPDGLPLPFKEAGHGSSLIHPFPFGGDEVAEVSFAAKKDLLRLVKKVGHTPLGGDKRVMFVGLLNVASHIGEPNRGIFKILLKGRLKVGFL